MATEEEAPLKMADLQAALENGVGAEEEEERVDHTEIERELDTLTLTGSTINDLELKLMRTRQLYRRTLEECRQQLETTRRRLNTHIIKSEPFVDVWRRARQIQEASNRAAARFDKANSQYTAAKEMIKVAEEKLALASTEKPKSPSALDLAWQEMLNHATAKVAATHKEKLESELEHKQILGDCQEVMEEYKNTERRLRSHIAKSRPYYEQRYEFNRRLQQIKRFILDLEGKVQSSKNTYTQTLRNLETMNTQIHERRRSSSLQTLLSKGQAERQRSSSALSLVTMKASQRDAERERRASSANTSPSMRRKMAGVHTNGVSEAESLESLQPGGLQGDFTGSTGSLPSIGESSVSVSDSCPTPDTREESNPPPALEGSEGSSLPPSSKNVPQEAPEITVSSPHQDEASFAATLVSEILERAAAQLEHNEETPEAPPTQEHPTEH